MSVPAAEPVRPVTVELAANEMLVKLKVDREYEAPDWAGSEPGGWHTNIDFELVEESLDADHAAGVTFEIEAGALFPDGWTVLERQMSERFEDRRQAVVEAARRTQDVRLVTPTGPLKGILEAFTKDA